MLLSIDAIPGTPRVYRLYPPGVSPRNRREDHGNADERAQLLPAGKSFITETVFSHPSKLDLVDEALVRRHLVHLHVILLPVDVAVDRVAERVRYGGHDVPEQKIRERYARLWNLISRALSTADRTESLDNSTAAAPFRRVAVYERGLLVGTPAWPAWTPPALTT